MRVHSFLASAVAAASVFVWPSAASGAEFTPGQPIAVDGNFAKDGEDLEKPSKEISGLACMAAKAGAARTCLAIDDEGRSAQFFTFDGSTMTPAKYLLEVINDKTPKKAFGAPPAKHDCPEVGDAFGDLDGEGVAYAKPYFYVVGSHGCSRNRGKYSPSSFITARIKVKDGAPAKDGPYPIETSFRLADALAIVHPASFGQRLGNTDHPSADGMNVEGVAIVGDILYAGLRAPSAGDPNLIVGVKISKLFAKGHRRYTGKPKTVEVKLGANIGIRDLAALSDGTLLVLAGPTREENLPYSLHIVDPVSEKVTALAVLKDKDIVGDVKAEGLLPIENGGKLSAVIMFDGLKNGGPKTFSESAPSN